MAAGEVSLSASASLKHWPLIGDSRVSRLPGFKSFSQASCSRFERRLGLIEALLLLILVLTLASCEVSSRGSETEGDFIKGDTSLTPPTVTVTPIVSVQMIAFSRDVTGQLDLFAITALRVVGEGIAVDEVAQQALWVATFFEVERRGPYLQ